MDFSSGRKSDVAIKKNIQDLRHDPNGDNSESNHRKRGEGSRPFARYRDIDEDMKKELVGLLE